MSVWETVSELATGAGTLVLAVATFASVRSANRSARTAQAAMQAAIRPVLINTRHQDPPQKLAFADDKWLVVSGGGAAVEPTQNAIYLGLSLRNVGTGMGILHGWRIRAGTERPPVMPAIGEFTGQTLDMYISPADVGFWEGALRDPTDPLFKEVLTAIETHDSISLDLLYGDLEGGQRVITRFRLLHSPWSRRAPASPASPASPAAPASRAGDEAPPGHVLQEGDPDQPGDPDAAGEAATAASGGPSAGSAEPSRWVANAVRHWNVDRRDPRDTEILSTPNADRSWGR